MEDPISSVVGSFASSFGISDVTMQLLIGSFGLILMAIQRVMRKALPLSRGR